MKIGKTQFIPENIAPPNAEKLAIYDGNTKLGEVDISKMQPSNLGEKLYSFGLLSDIHMMATSGTSFSANGMKFNNALTFFENQGCSFVCVSGDITNHGFWNSYGTKDLYQFGEFKRACDLHPNLDVYTCCGNHDSYNKSIAETLTDLVEYTGYGLTYTVTQGNDVFIFVGQSVGTLPMSEDSLTWLGNTLEANKNKRCFVFIHPFVDKNGAGNPLGLHHEPLFEYWGANKQNFINLMSGYPKAVLLHGHSHIELESQLVVKHANYSANLGFKEIHIPGTASTRSVSTGEMVGNDNGQQGYICDVYANHIVLEGYDFQKNEAVPIAQYCIPT